MFTSIYLLVSYAHNTQDKKKGLIGLVVNKHNICCIFNILPAKKKKKVFNVQWFTDI